MNRIEFKFFMGIDVQTRRGCSYLILDEDGKSFKQGWLEGDSNENICSNLVRVVKRIDGNKNGYIAVGIDSPRLPLKSQREHFWDGRRQRWRSRREGEKGYGRHCEVVLKALNIANPQWTSIRENCPDWMILGFALFSCLRQSQSVFEVFPSASYKLLNNLISPEVSINFNNFAFGPKDMIDACIAAVTVMEFVQGRGSEVGGGDGLGSIILPTALSVAGDHSVLQWPSK